MDSPVTRIDEIVDGIYRISSWQEPYGITLNQFLIADERPALIHTGMHHLYDGVRDAIRQVLDPAKLSCIVLLHWEGDENGGMDRFMNAAPQSELIGSLLSIQLNASAAKSRKSRPCSLNSRSLIRLRVAHASTRAGECDPHSRTFPPKSQLLGAPPFRHWSPGGMDKNYTEIAFILDRSGSMES